MLLPGDGPGRRPRAVRIWLGVGSIDRDQGVLLACSSFAFFGGQQPLCFLVHRGSCTLPLDSNPSIHTHAPCRLMKLSVVHDLAEALVGDIVPHDERYTKEQKRALEEVCSTRRQGGGWGGGG